MYCCNAPPHTVIIRMEDLSKTTGVIPIQEVKQQDKVASSSISECIKLKLKQVITC